MNSDLAQHTESVEIRSRIILLRKELQQLLEDWFHLSDVVRPALTARYDGLFGELEAQIQRKALEAAEIGRRAELLGLKHSRGERITPEVVRLVNIIVDKEFAVLSGRVVEAFGESAAKRSNDVDTAGNREDSEFPKMYRAIVKKLHPDVSGATEQFRKYWNGVQEAFETKNTSKMKAIYTALAGAEIGDDGGNTMPAETLSELRRQLRELEDNVGRERRKLAYLLSEEPFTLAEKLGHSDWIAAHRKKLEEQITRKERESFLSREAISQFTGGAVSPEISEQPDERERQANDDDFLGNTYFGNR